MIDFRQARFISFATMIILAGSVALNSSQVAQAEADLAPTAGSAAPQAGASPTAQATSAPSQVASPSATPGEQGLTLRKLLNHFLPSSDKASDQELGKDEDDLGATDDGDDSDTVSFNDWLSADELRQALPWQATNFAGQTTALGWSEHVFDVPKGLELRVAFWRDVYSKYSTNEGILHDRDHLDVIYEHMDFAELMADQSKNVYQKAKLRERLVRQKRKEIEDRLKRLHKLKTSDGLSGEDLRLWKLWENVSDADKFKDAAGRHRVRFQLGQKDRFIIGIYHSGRYLREMERIFREEGLPIELTRLPFVESSFNIHARSRVGASGVWQFMRRTARAYLHMNSAVDERNDPWRATRASARLLKNNFTLLGSWPLAVTGYNHGPNGIRRIAKKLGTNDLAEIIDVYSSRHFGFASENFYACFLAALEIEKNAKIYFGEAKWGPAVDVAEVRLKKPMSYQTLLEFFDGDWAATELANPHLLAASARSHLTIPARTYIRIPPSRVKIAENYTNGTLSAAQLHLALLTASKESSFALPMPSQPILSPTPSVEPAH